MNSIIQKTLFKIWYMIKRNKEILVAYVVWIRVDKNRAYTLLTTTKNFTNPLLANQGHTHSQITCTQMRCKVFTKTELLWRLLGDVPKIGNKLFYFLELLSLLNNQTIIGKILCNIGLLFNLPNFKRFLKSKKYSILFTCKPPCPQLGFWAWKLHWFLHCPQWQYGSLEIPSTTAFLPSRPQLPPVQSLIRINH